MTLEWVLLLAKTLRRYLKKLSTHTVKNIYIKKLSTLQIAMFTFVALLFPVGTSFAAPVCVGGDIGVLDWNARDWPDPLNPTNASGDYVPTLTNTETNIGGVGGIDMTFTFSSDTTNANFIRSLENYADANGATGVDTINDDVTLVGPGGGEAGLAAVVNPTDTAGNPIDMDIFLDITFSDTLAGLEVTISDIDASGTREDIMTVTGFYMGIPVYPTLSVNPVTTATFTIGGINNNVATAIPGSGNRSPTLNPEDATLVVSFDQPIDSYQIIYGDNNEAGGNIGGLRGTSMANQFEFCQAFDIGGTVYTDADGDGAFSAGDTVLSGVTVELYDATGTILLETTTTLADGSYAFIDKAPESYVIRETDPSGYVSVTDSVGANDNEIPVTLTNSDLTNQDFLDILSADLRVVKDDSSLTYTPGTSGTYTITVTNLGPADVLNATVLDNLPAGISLTGPVTCVATGSASCTVSIGTTGGISFTDTAVSITADPTGTVNFVTYTVPVTFSNDMADY